MKTFAWLLGILLLGLPAAADEILLKDGKKIAWTSIRDMGDTYEVETPGGKISVRKAEVDRITTAILPETPPLTGASFTFEKKKKLVPTNLLAGLDLKKSSFQGQWTLKGNELQGSAGVDANSRLFFTTPVPDEYDLHLEIARKSGDGDFEIGLVAAGRQGMVILDTLTATISGFCFDGKAPSPGVPGRFFTNNTPRAIVCMVRKNGIVIQVDGKDYMTCPEADLPKFSISPAHAVPRQDVIFFCCWKSNYAITKAVLMTPKAQP
jgi:hypothetical protein